MKNSKIRKKFYAEWSEAKKKNRNIKEGPKNSILGPQNLGSEGGAGPPLDPHLDTCKNIIFPHTPYAVGKNYSLQAPLIVTEHFPLNNLY